MEFLSSNFEDHYVLKGQILGLGIFSQVESCRKKNSPENSKNFAVKIIHKKEGFFQRSKMLAEIETYHLCNGHPHIIQLLEYFENPKAFHLVFEMLEGGPLLNLIQKRTTFSEQEASLVTKELAE